jgi:CubicO group peptidase (beta-lactamase class C family)
MRRLLTWRVFGWAAAFAFSLILLALAVMTARWVVAAGPHAGLVAMSRLFKHGSTKIDDFKHYPARHLQASSNPYHFMESVDRSRIPQTVTLEDFKQRDIEDLLQKNDTITFLIVKDDTLIFERYYQGHTPASLSQFFSISKSITSVLVGAAIDDGYIQSVYQSVTDFVPELGEHGFAKVTLKHLLTMASAIDYTENDNPLGLHVILNYTPDVKKMILDFRLRGKPGHEFKYKSCDTALIGLILERALSPMTITEYAQKRIWSPLGMEYDGMWSLDGDDGLEKTWCCLCATCRDLAKLGRLYLHQGVWDGQRILSADWVKQSTGLGAIDEGVWLEDLRAVGCWNYGYYWRIVSQDEGDYLALGKDGQFLYVNPARKLIIVRLGWSKGDLRASQWISFFKFLAHEIN